MPKLKTCPFCGKDEALMEDAPIRKSNGGFLAYRVRCGYCGTTTAYYSDKWEAAANWNDRGEKNGTR